ncbi:hypothetical protein ACVWWN_002697 [Mycobacterium sp. URHB0021]
MVTLLARAQSCHAPPFPPLPLRRHPQRAELYCSSEQVSVCAPASPGACSDRAGSRPGRPTMRSLIRWSVRPRQSEACCVSSGSATPVNWNPCCATTWLLAGDDTRAFGGDVDSRLRPVDGHTRIGRTEPPERAITVDIERAALVVAGKRAVCTIGSPARWVDRGPTSPERRELRARTARAVRSRDGPAAPAARVPAAPAAP